MKLYMIEGKQRLHTERTISQAFMMSPKDSVILRLKDIPIDQADTEIHGYVLTDGTQYLCGRHAKGSPYMSPTDAPRYYKSTKRDTKLTFNALVKS